MIELDRKLLRAALASQLPGRAGEGAWRELAAALAQPNRLDELRGERQDLLGLVHQAAEASGAQGEIVRLLAGVRRRNWAAAQPRLAAARAARVALQDSGVRHLPLGDLAMVEILGDSGLHPVRQLRLALEPSDRPAAEAALAQAGWQRQPAGLDDPEATRWHSPAGQELRLAALALLPEPALLTLLIELSARPAERLIWLADIGLLGGRLDGGGWRGLLELAQRDGCLSPLRCALSACGADLVRPAGGPPIPLPSLRDRLAFRLQGRSPVLALHLRSGRPLVRGLPGSLQRGWQLESGRALPAAAGARLRARAAEIAGR